MKDIKKYIKQLTSSDFNRNVFLLFSGSGIAQVIPIIATVILTRIYTEQEFGTFFLFTSIVTILSVISSLKIEPTIVLSPADKEAKQLFSLGAGLAILTSLLFLFIILFFKPWLVIRLNIEGNSNWLWLIPLATLLNGLFQLSNNVLIRLKRFKRISLSNVIKSSSSTSYHSLAGLIKATSLQLIFGNLLGIASACVSNILKIRKLDFGVQCISWILAKKLIRKYKEFPLYNTGISLTNAISHHIPVILLTSFYGLNIAGLYGLSLRVVRVPLSLMSQAYGEVFYREASQLYNKDRSLLKSYVKKNYWSLFKIGVLPFLILFVAAPPIFELIFGENWNLAGTYTRILAPWLFISFLNAPILRVLSIIRRQKFLMIYNTLLLITRISGIYLGYVVWNDELLSILFYGMAGLFFNIYIMIFMFNLNYKNIE